MLRVKFTVPIILAILVLAFWAAPSAMSSHTAPAPTAASDITASQMSPIPTQLVPNNWPLIPSRLGPGDSFRLMFVTESTTDATTNGIGRYNSFVANQAQQHSEFKSQIALNFRALVSVYQGLDARGNTLTRSGDPGASSPIYWVGGDKVADSYADFYDGSWDSRVSRTARGALFTNEHLRVHTGSTRQGTPAIGTDANNLNWSLALGSPPAPWAWGVRKSAYGEIGRSTHSTPGHEIHAAYHNSSDAATFYGISPLLKVRDGAGPQPAVSGPTAVGYGEPFDVTITFPEDAQINGMDLSDLTVRGGFTSNLRHTAAAGGGTAYVVTITPADAFVGWPTIKVSLSAGAVTDVNGWSSVASNTFTVDIGRTTADPPVPAGGL